MSTKKMIHDLGFRNVYKRKKLLPHLFIECDWGVKVRDSLAAVMYA